MMVPSVAQSASIIRGANIHILFFVHKVSEQLERAS